MNTVYSMFVSKKRQQAHDPENRQEFISLIHAIPMFYTDCRNRNTVEQIKKGQKKSLKVKIEYEGPIEAPIKKDQEIGKLTIELDDELQEYPVYSSNKVKKVNFFKSLFLSFNYMIWGDV